MSDTAAFVGSVPDHYDKYLGPVLFEPFAKVAAEKVAKRPGMRLLEVAAGTGRLTRHLLSQRSEDGQIVATDLNDDMLRVARSRISDPRLDYRVADAQELPFPDRSFDGVLCQFGIMFVPEKLKFLREAFRVLKPRRQLLYSVWGPFKHNRHSGALDELLIELFPEDPPTFLHVPYGSYDERENLNLMADAGFTHLHCEAVDLTFEADSAENFAKGLMLGSPMVAMLGERGVTDFDELGRKIVDRFTKEFGDFPMRTNMQAIFVSGEKPQDST